MASNPSPLKLKQRKWALIAFALFVLYVLARPTLERQFGVQLPGPEGSAASVESPAGPENPLVQDAARPDEGSRQVRPGIVELPSESASVAEIAGDNATVIETDSPTAPEENANSQPALGKLKQIGNKLFESTAGLRYGSGSAEGHRLLHVMAHAEDDLQKPIHGVFDGTKEEILATIDEAWMLVKKHSPQVTTEQEDDRTTYTVDLKRRIGYTGGEVGQRRNHPPCRKLRIVVEGVDVVTAFPTER